MSGARPRTTTGHPYESHRKGNTVKDYIKQYQALDETASSAESKADEYRQRADENRWEQCRIVHEAVESGEFSRRSFAEAVGKGETTVRRQYHMWEQWGASPGTHRPSYQDAYAEARGRPQGPDRTREITRGGIRTLPPEQKREVARELANDPDVADDLPTRAAVTQSFGQASERQERRSDRDETDRTKGLRSTTELMQALGIMTDLEDKAARVGRIWREHGGEWTEEDRATVRESWDAVVAEVTYTTDALEVEGWDDALANLVDQEG